MPSSSTLKVLLTSTAIVSVAVTMKLAVPMISTGFPAVRSTLATWLKPPYLYVIINGIIITIAASTRFQHDNNNHHENESQPQEINPSNTPPPSDLTSELPTELNRTSYGVMELPSVDYGINPSATVETVTEKVVEPEVVGVGSTYNLSQSVVDGPLGEEVEPEFGLPVKEKEPVTSRFANNRKSAKASPEGVRALRVLKPKKHETLETTWKMITDGRQLPLTRHLRKSDTFDNLHHDRQTIMSTTTTKSKVVKKSETFKERTTYANQNDTPQPPLTSLTPSTGGKLKKDGSLSHDELNRRVEAFIKKFNDDMRLQRQESLKQYMDMVKGGSR